MNDDKILIPLPEVSHIIGMQDQYFFPVLVEKQVNGIIKDKTDYHSYENKVYLESVLRYIEWKFNKHIISYNQYIEYIGNIKKLIEQYQQS